MRDEQAIESRFVSIETMKNVQKSSRGKENGLVIPILEFVDSEE